MQLLLSVVVVLLALLSLPVGAQGQHTVSAEIAPNRTLRVGFQTASPILAKRGADGSVSGVAVDFGRFIADKLGVAFEPVAYANQEAYSQSFGRGEWDMVIGVRGLLADPSPDFMVPDAMYIAAPGRVFADATEVDATGVKVGLSRGGGSDRFLSQALKSAQVVRVPPMCSEAGRWWSQSARFPARSTSRISVA